MRTAKGGAAGVTAYSVECYRIEPYLRRWSNVRLWLQPDLRSPEIDFCFTPESGRSIFESDAPRQSCTATIRASLDGAFQR